MGLYEPSLFWVVAISVVVATPIFLLGVHYKSKDKGNVPQIEDKRQVLKRLVGEQTGEFILGTMEKDWVSGWKMSHFFIYFVFGYIYPSQFWVFLWVGFIWELLEAILSKMLRFKYWYASPWDLVYNSMGFLAGSGARMLIHDLASCKAK